MIDADARVFEELHIAGLASWCDTLTRSREFTLPEQHGHFATWQQIVQDLPKPANVTPRLKEDAVTMSGSVTSEQLTQIRHLLMQLHPWRKGPFDLFGVLVDAEWQSNLKWNRIQSLVNWSGKKVLDVGCGNGYYGYRMLGQGAHTVIGLEPYPLYNAQFAAVSSLATALNNFVIPASDRALDVPLRVFDVVLSMGVLYHCKDPMGHLGKLRDALTTGGALVIETLVVDGDEQTLFLPEQRYAKMRNVWFLPSALMLDRMLRRVGFGNVSLVDITKTSENEQRRTEWMTFESLADFLDPRDPTKTIEGYPAPQRAILVAECRR